MQSRPNSKPEENNAFLEDIPETTFREYVIKAAAVVTGS